MSNNTPRVAIGADKQKDIEQFAFFLNPASGYARLRSKILNFYPKLEERIREVGQEQACAEIVLDMYRRFDEVLNDMITVIKNEFATATPAFDALAKYMAISDLHERSFVCIPTFLPFSPIDDKGNAFFFSIANAIAGNPSKPYRAVNVGIHEISHFIFFDQMASWAKKHGNSLNDAATHYFKEALTAALMDQKEFREFFGYENYPGNEELHELSIIYQGKTMNIVQFFKNEVFDIGHEYYSALASTLDLFFSRQDVFTQKWSEWNVAKSKDDLKKYKNPIEL